MMERSPAEPSKPKRNGKIKTFPRGMRRSKLFLFTTEAKLVVLSCSMEFFRDAKRANRSKIPEIVKDLVVDKAAIIEDLVVARC